MSNETEQEMPLIPDDHRESTCKVGQGAETCAFITFHNGWRCVKGSDVEAFVRMRRATMKAQGDNCAGPPDFVVAPIGAAGERAVLHFRNGQPYGIRTTGGATLVQCPGCGLWSHVDREAFTFGTEGPTFVGAPYLICGHHQCGTGFSITNGTTVIVPGFDCRTLQ